MRSRDTVDKSSLSVSVRIEGGHMVVMSRDRGRCKPSKQGKLGKQSSGWRVKHVTQNLTVLFIRRILVLA